MQRTREDALHIAELDHLADIHDADLRRSRADDAEIVRHEQIGQLERILQIQEEIQNLRLHRDIERRYGLVSDDEPRLQPSARAMPMR